MNTIETLICTHLQHEGLGSLYERVVLSHWFRDLATRHGYASILEYSCSITKGYDNVTLLEQGLSATVADRDVGSLQAGWRYPLRPAFSTLEQAPQADLVWNFAQVQMDATLIDAMKTLTQKHLLVFVPNILNPGTPVHLAYHVLTRTRCRHAERGSVRIRTRPGLLRLLASRGITVIESGYIDAPPIPDIAFSIRELKETLGWARADDSHGQGSAPAADPALVWKRVQAMLPFEYSRLLAPFKPFVGHHIYALGRIV